MIAELDVDCSATELSDRRGVVAYHRRCSILIRHFQKRLEQKTSQLWLVEVNVPDLAVEKKHKISQLNNKIRIQ